MSNIHKNTCPAFFLDATINSAGNYSPCTALGGGVFKFGQQSFRVTWADPILANARNRSQAGEQLEMCQRCWSEEKLGFTSERQYLIADLPAGLDYTDPGYYMSGPRHLNIKVSNICNLRCRTCQSYDSYLYNLEGEYYEKKYNLTDTPYAKEKFKKHFTDEQLDELYEFSVNLERIELYGGEPFLDDQIPKFLLRLVESGRSRNIDFSVSTNATHELTDTWRQILLGFKSAVINTSIDGIGEQFRYMRHPGEWSNAEKNLKEFFELEYSADNITVQPVITVSALNVWSVGDVFEYFKSYNVEPFIILVQWPAYYCVNVIPDTIKAIIEQRLNSYNNPKFEPIISLMNTEPKIPDAWNEFKFWTRAKDEYRKESFTDTFKELGETIIKNNLWQ